MEGAAKSLEALARFNAAVPSAVLGDPQDRAQQGSPARRARRVQPEAREEDRRSRHHGRRASPAAPPTCTSTGSRSRKGAEARRRASSWRCRPSGGIKRQVKRLSQGTNLHDISGGIEAYKGLFIPEIDAQRDIVELSNGDVISAGRGHRGRDRGRRSGASRSARSSAPTSTRSESSSPRASRCCRCSSSTRSPSTATTRGRTPGRLRARVRRGV